MDKIPTVAQAQQNLERADRKLEELRQQKRKIEREIYRYEDLLSDLRRDLLRAQLEADSDALPVGARVQHRRFRNVFGTVAESDGRGIAVIPDGRDEPTYGFTSGEWEPID